MAKTLPPWAVIALSQIDQFIQSLLKLQGQANDAAHEGKIDPTEDPTCLALSCAIRSAESARDALKCHVSQLPGV